MKLVCFDMDGVIFKDVNFWLELHKAFGTFEEGKELTEKYLHTDYPKLVEEVVGRLWKGRNTDPYFELVQSLEYLPGVKKAFASLKEKGFVTAIISASSLDVAKRAKEDLGVDHIFANELVIKDNRVTGEFRWPIGAGREHKANVMKRLCEDIGVALEDVTYVGDTDMDIEAFKAAGFSIAFNSASAALKEVANVVVDSNNLEEILPHINL